jgi:hypothetical protein
MTHCSHHTVLVSLYPAAVGCIADTAACCHHLQGSSDQWENMFWLYRRISYWVLKNNKTVYTIGMQWNQLDALFTFNLFSHYTYTCFGLASSPPWGGRSVCVCVCVYIYIYVCVLYIYTQWNLGSRTPLITNKSVHEQIFQQESLGWQTVSSVTNMQAGNNGWRQAGNIDRRVSVAL